MLSPCLVTRVVRCCLLCDCLQDDADAVDNATMKQRNDEDEDAEGRQDTGEVGGRKNNAFFPGRCIMDFTLVIASRQKTRDVSFPTQGLVSG